MPRDCWHFFFLPSKEIQADTCHVFLYNLWKSILASIFLDGSWDLLKQVCNNNRKSKEFYMWIVMISLNTLSNICFYMLWKCLALFDSSLSLDWITSVSESLEAIGWNTILFKWYHWKFWVLQSLHLGDCSGFVFCIWFHSWMWIQ